eukprot:TRINITY_DN88_c0_g2_i1.p1 TRINITY_DN88_c0_g2~~TRINITY_DN88_c0_g2_i1.p1  ORF type:complete len:192 (+),score=58.41 TRINITY_DN88_c0_g2_i1:286-861(+)
MNFRVRFSVVECSSGEPVPGLSALSGPIQVISKPEVLDKKNVVSRKRKRTSPNESIMQALAKIQQTQEEHTRLLREQQSTSLPMKHSSDVCDLSFEEAFRLMVRSYADTEPSERASKLRRVASSLDEDEEEALSCLVDEVAAQGYSSSASPDSSPSSVGSGSSMADDALCDAFDPICDRYQDFVQTLVGSL